MQATRNILICVCIAGAICSNSTLRADFTFGEPVNLRLVIPVIDPTLEGIDCFSCDGLEVYLTSDRPGGQGQADLWVLKRSSTEAEWGPPENVGPVVNSPSADYISYLSADGLTLYFSSNRPGGYGGLDIYMTTRATKDSPWGTPVNLGPKINTAQGDGDVCVSSNGLELYFTSWCPGGYGNDDIYVARRETIEDAWGQAINLGPMVNSPYDEEFLSLSPDGLLLLFSERCMGVEPRPGGFGRADIWMTRRASLSAPWEPPVDLGDSINGASEDVLPRISPDGSALYYSTASTLLDPSTWENWQAPIIPVVDFNGDTNVDLEDLRLLIDNWGTDDTLYDIGPYAWGDGTVDIEDLKVFVAEWEKESQAAQP